MSDSPSFRFRKTNDVEEIRQLILDIHVEVRGEFGLMSRPFYQVERFDERLTMYAARPGWNTVIGYDGDEAIGFVFGVPLGPDSRWWASMLDPLPENYVKETGARTFAVQEIAVRGPWRGSAGAGASRQLHEQILDSRQEERATLLVDPTVGNGGVKRVYESWGYEEIGKQQPFADSPVFSAMVLAPLHP